VLFLSYYKYRIQYGRVSFYNQKDFKNFEQKGKNLEKTEKKKLFLSEEDLEKSLLSAEFAPLFKEFQVAAEEFFKEFLEKKKNSSFLTIEDLLLFSYYLLDKNHGIVDRFNKEWDYWLIDEYQDTSFLQDQVIEKVTGFKKVFCVGDPGQSIYSFRGAEPQVFLNREKQLKNEGGKIKELKINYRSSPSLISFYNDFFEDGGFMEFKASPDKKKPIDKSCVSFFTYNLETEKNLALQKLSDHIKSLRNKGVGLNEIAILSSENQDLAKIADYLRKENLPLMLHSSKNFSDKRLILDSLFLLKFLINPYDDDNLKALLRTPYFRLSDQELADSSYEYYQKTQQSKSIQSFWLFIKNKYKEEYFAQALSFGLENHRRKGLFESFKQALFDSGIMDLAYFQDPTQSSAVNLWKLVYLLKQNKSSALALFYKLMASATADDNFREAPTAPEDNQFLELMTIHKSKGLEFKHVIILDFSLSKSSLKTGNKESDNYIYDRFNGKMAFSVPIGGRNKRKIKSYGHKVYKKALGQEKSPERDRLFYVAMTRAKESLAMFIPHEKMPEKNSWLTERDYFERTARLSETRVAVGGKKQKTWWLNTGVYNQGEYLLTVESCKKLNVATFSVIKHGEKKLEESIKHGQEEKTVKNKAYREEKKETPTLENKEIQKKKPSKDSCFQSDDRLGENDRLRGDDMSGGKERSGEGGNSSSGLIFKSSGDFVEYQLAGSKKAPVKSFQSRSHIKNVLFKTSAGAKLHFFLQKLFYLSPDDMQVLLKSQDENTKAFIRPAMDYILSLEEPPLSSFFKKGFSEWSFQFKKENLVLQGRIDLWSQLRSQLGSKLDSVIHVLDYKSSAPPKKTGFNPTRSQLVFYSWVLNEIYHPDQIFMYECYPLEKATKKTKFNLEDKKAVDQWISQSCLSTLSSHSKL